MRLSNPALLVTVVLGGALGACTAKSNPAPAAAPAAPQVPPPLDPATGGVFRSDDRGRTWKLQSNCNSRPMYFSQLRVDPQNPNTIYVAGLPVAKSMDGGKTFATLDDAGGNGAPAHVDQHAIWIDPKNAKHLMIGNDGGVMITTIRGKEWSRIRLPIAQIYHVATDNKIPYEVGFVPEPVCWTQVPNDLRSLLRNQAGVEFSTNGGMGTNTSLFMRGANSNQVLIMIDGEGALGEPEEPGVDTNTVRDFTPRLASEPPAR